MSQRAAWQLDRLGFSEVYDFVVGKAYWLANGRPTVRAHEIDRVGSSVVPAVTASVDDSVATIRQSVPGSDSDVVIVDERQIVLGRVRRSDLDAADGSDVLGGIMRLGPTTARPDELVGPVSERMRDRGVDSLLVTRPTGVLLGLFVPSDTAADDA